MIYILVKIPLIWLTLLKLLKKGIETALMCIVQLNWEPWDWLEAIEQWYVWEYLGP